MTSPSGADDPGFAAAAPQRSGSGAFRLLWACSVAVPVLAVALAGWSAWNDVVRYQSGEIRRTLAMVNEQTLRTLELQDALLAALEARIEGMPWERIATDPALHGFVGHLAAGAPAVLNVAVINPDGRTVLTSAATDPPPGIRFSDRAFFRAFPPGADASRAYVSEVLLSRATGRMQIHLARGRRGADGRADGGVLTTAFVPGYFESFFSGVAETPASGFIVLRTEGQVLARFPDRVAGAGERLADDDSLLAAGRALPAGASPQVLRSGSMPSGLRLRAVRRAGSYDVLTVASIDPAVIRDAWLEQMTPLAIGGAVAMTLMLLLTGQAQRRLHAERAALMHRTIRAEAAGEAAQTRAELASRLRQTEKVAALGHLAAGVAHDFNNLLQSIMVSAETLSQPGVPEAEVRHIGALILRVSERGVALTRRMLDYARRDDLPGGDTDVAASLGELREWLGHTLGPRYRLRVEVDASEGLRARGHPAEFETVIINLAVNARDAMPGGGDITIAVTGAEETRPRSESGLAPGRYLRIAVTDTGQGMDASALARAGEAFFTTKLRGQGTGLGLSMARGFARRAGGKLDLASAPGQGTIVTLWLPAE